MEEVKHMLWADGPIGVDKVSTHVKELSLRYSGQPGAQIAINGCILLPQRIRILPSRQQTLMITEIKFLFLTLP